MVLRGLLYLLYRAFQHEFSARRIWALYGVIAAVDFLAIGLSAWLGTTGQKAH
jgi:hypothetical protein